MRLGLVGSIVVSGVAAAQQPQAPLNNGALPSVSPDGKYVAFTSNRGGTNDLYVIQADGSNLVRLTNSPENESAPQWTSDGGVAFSVTTGDTARVFTIRPDGSALKGIATILQTRSPALSRDGTRLVYSAGRFPKTVLTTSKLDGTDQRRLGDSTKIVFNAVMSPDGKQIAYARADTARGPLSVWVMNADGTGAKQLTHVPESEGSPQWPAWSADGRRLAVQVGKYNRNTPQENTAHIWLVDLNGVATKVAAHEKPYLDETPSWFPDGKHLAIQSNRTGRMEVWIIAIDGSEARQLTK